LPRGRASENDPRVGNQISDFFPIVKDHAFEVQVSEAEDAGSRESGRGGTVLRVHLVGSLKGAFYYRVQRRGVDGTREGYMPAAIEGGRAAGGDWPDASDVALEAKSVRAFNGELRAPLSVVVLILCLDGGDKIGADTCSATGENECSGEQTTGNDDRSRRRYISLDVDLSHGLLSFPF
jgi:hypothetical protein